MIAQALLDQYHAVPAQADQRSGVMVYLQFAGLPLKFSSGRCDHQNIDIALFYTGREPDDAVSALVVCPKCGVITACASQLTTPAQMRPVTDATRRIFGYSDQQFRRDPRVQWGMVYHPPESNLHLNAGG